MSESRPRIGESIVTENVHSFKFERAYFAEDTTDLSLRQSRMAQIRPMPFEIGTIAPDREAM